MPNPWPFRSQQLHVGMESDLILCCDKYWTSNNLICLVLQQLQKINEMDTCFSLSYYLDEIHE